MVLKLKDHRQFLDGVREREGGKKGLRKVVDSTNTNIYPGTCVSLLKKNRYKFILILLSISVLP